MDTKTVLNDIQNLFARSFSVPGSQEASAQDCCYQAFLPATAQCKFLGFQDIALNQIDEDTVEEDKGKSRFNLWDILFPDRGLETYRMLEGEDMTPFVAYKSGNRYYVADGNGRLAAARYMGKAYILAEVWEWPCR